MLDFLYTYPNWFIVSVFVVVFISVAIVIMLGLRSILPIVDDMETFDIGLRAVPAALSITSFVLAFSVVQANNELERAAKIVADEAHAISQFDRLLLRTDPEVSTDTRRALAAYVRSILDDEWSYMRGDRTGFGHPHTHELVAALTNTTLDEIHHATSSVQSEILRAVDQIEDLRDQRLHEANATIPSLFWGVILSLALLMMGFGVFFKPTLAGLGLVAGHAAAVGLLTAFLFCIDRPFAGSARLEPTQLTRVAAALSIQP